MPTKIFCQILKERAKFPESLPLSQLFKKLQKRMENLSKTLKKPRIWLDQLESFTISVFGESHRHFRDNWGLQTQLFHETSVDKLEI